MSGPEFIVAVVAISCITGLLKKWMDQRDSNSDIGNSQKVAELERSFSQHRKEMKKRIENLEAIIADEEEYQADNYQQIEASSENRLSNDLQQKEQVSS